MADTAPTSPRPDPSIFSANLFDVSPGDVILRVSSASASVQLGPVSMFGPVRMSIDITEQLETLRDIGAEIVAQATAAIEQRARIQAVTS